MLEENHLKHSGVFNALSLAGLLLASANQADAAGLMDVTKTLKWNNSNPSTVPVCGTRVDAFLFYPDTDTVKPAQRIAARSYNARASSYRPYGGPLPTSDAITVRDVDTAKDWVILYIAHFLGPKPEFGTDPDTSCEAAFQYVGTGTNPYITSTRDIGNIQDPNTGNTHFTCTSSFFEAYSPPDSPDYDEDGIGDDAEKQMGSSVKNPNSDSDGSNDKREFCLVAAYDSSIVGKITVDGKTLTKTKNFFFSNETDGKVLEEVYAGQRPFPSGFNNM